MNSELQTKLESLAFQKSIPFCYGCYTEAPTGRCNSCGSDDLIRLLPGIGCEYGTEWIIILPKLGERGATFGKPDGSGLGFSYARKLAEGLGGSLLITSNEGKGTEVTIEFPLAKTPEWFIEKLEIGDATVVILDDAPSILALWDEKLRALPKNCLIHFKNGDEFSTLVKEQAPSIRRVVYLVDCELFGQKRTGLDLISELKIEQNSILVTGRYDEPSVIARVLWVGIKMIPKTLLSTISITLR